MRLVRHIRDLPHVRLREGSVVTIGSFDGLHRGHEALLEQVFAAAALDGLPSVVMSFEPTPREFFQAERPPARLMRFREKLDALAAHRVDLFYCPRFSAAMRSIRAVDFVRRILVHGLNARTLVIGDDFHFARQREGDAAFLGRLAPVLGFSLVQVPSIVIDGERVSSTAVREACEAGDMQRAERLLGRPYRMSGRVVRGASLGRRLGFPTANVDLRRRQSAVEGIFAVRVHGIAATPLSGVASVGSRPTFDGTKPLLEVHLFDYEGDLYGKYIHVDFIARLRGQEKYADVADLVAQMHVDADNARSALTAHPSYRTNA
ncbi:MAG TPA: bifunctional riboflavin kinase/FAD synthetase [Woeseiaceae bacterium]|nr:bifunctional riboflavin kinase/FAD synthetase [Woeseiaceae bacterium]